MYAVFLACSGMLWAGTPPPERARLPVTHPIARGETHSYELMVPAQTYVRLVLDQVDIDTWVQGEGTAGEAVFESSRGGLGRERYTVASREPGVYRLLVIAAGNSSGKVSYRLWIHEMRRARPTDEAVSEGQRRLDAALRDGQDAAGFRRAAESFAKAGDKPCEMEALSLLGAALHRRAAIMWRPCRCSSGRCRLRDAWETSSK